MAALTITPRAGIYQVLVTGEYSTDTDGRMFAMALAQDNSRMAERALFVVTAGNYKNVTLTRRIEFNGSQELRVQIRRVGGPAYLVILRDCEVGMIRVTPRN